MHSTVWERDVIVSDGSTVEFTYRAAFMVSNSLYTCAHVKNKHTAKS